MGDAGEVASDTYVPAPRYSTKTLRPHPIITASNDGNLAAVKAALRQDPRCVHAPNPVNGWTAAQYAANMGRLDILKVLVRADPKCIFIRNGSGSTLGHLVTNPKQCSLSDSHLGLLLWLIKKHPAIVSEGDAFGGSIAHRLAFSSAPGTWMFLKAVLKSDPSLVVMLDSFGMTPVKCLRGACLSGRHLGSAGGEGECCTCRLLVGCYEGRRIEREWTVMSGQHERIGRGSLLRLLEEGLLRSILAEDRCKDYEEWVESEPPTDEDDANGGGVSTDPGKN